MVSVMIMFCCFLFVVVYPPNWGEQQRYIDSNDIFNSSPAPDPNFNQFGSTTPINGTSPNNGAWANFNQQPQSTKMQWMNSNGSANPFMVSVNHFCWFVMINMNRTAVYCMFSCFGTSALTVILFENSDVIA